MPHRRPPVQLALTLAFGVLACDGAPTPPDARTLLDEGGERVAMTRLREEPFPLAFHSGIREPARTVVRDEPLWRATWAAIRGSTTPEPPLPVVDFAREMVVVAALGERRSGGHAIVLDSATRRGETLVVHLRTRSPDARCAVTAALTQPVDAARLARHDGPVEFRERAEVARCD